MSTAAVPEVRVDANFARICFPLPTDEAEALERSLLTWGCREPLVVWAERGILLDGHNRFRICNAHSIPFEVVRYSFDSRQDAHDFVIRNQLARRNVTPQQASYLRGKLYDSQKRDRTETLRQGAERGVPSGQTDATGATRDRIARSTGVSPRTVERDARKARAIDQITESAGEGARDAILSGDAQMSAADLDVLAEAAPQSAAEVRQFAEDRRAARLRERRSPNKDGAWGQFEVVRVITAEDDEGVYVKARELSCGHVVDAARRVAYRGPGTGTKSANCPTCKPGTRTPHERRRFERVVERALDRAWKDQAQRPLVVEFVVSALRALAFAPFEDARADALLRRCGELRGALRLTEDE